MENQEVCPITMEPINDLRILPCAHKFESMAIEQWLIDNNNCPVCRTRVQDDSRREIQQEAQRMQPERNHVRENRITIGNVEEGEIIRYFRDIFRENGAWQKFTRFIYDYIRNSQYMKSSDYFQMFNNLHNQQQYMHNEYNEEYKNEILTNMRSMIRAMLLKTGHVSEEQQIFIIRFRYYALLYKEMIIDCLN